MVSFKETLTKELDEPLEHIRLEQQEVTEQSSRMDENEDKDEDDVPIELQCEEVDMNDPMMDPLEWSVRKVIPIPKQYYWETTNSTEPANTSTTEPSSETETETETSSTNPSPQPINPKTISTKTKLWHNTIYALGKTLHGAEAAGGFIASALGINRSSRFDYVTSTMTPEQWEQAEKNAEEQKKRREEYLKTVQDQEVLKESGNV